MARILAIDYGQKRTGLAVTDPLQIVASGLDTVPTKDLKDWIRAYLAKEPVEAIVVGMPSHAHTGEATNNTLPVQLFVSWCKNHLTGLTIHTIDERFTTVMAKQTMLSSGINKKARANKETVDKISAVIILQSFMEKRGLGF